jgi:hypothetical protein
MLGAQAAGDPEAVHRYAHNLYFETAAMIPCLITVGKMLEAMSKGRTTDALKSLMKLAPKTAVLWQNGKELEVEIERVRTGDLFVVRPGESVPVDVGPGDSVISGGVNLTDTLKNMLQASGVGTRAFQVVFDIIDSVYDIVIASGIQIIVFLSGMQNIPASLYEAAHVEGCSGWESFWKITFPMVSPLLLVNAIYTIIDFFTKSNNQVMEKISKVMYANYKFGVASAMSWIYFGVSILMIGVASLIITLGVKNVE